MDGPEGARAVLAMVARGARDVARLVVPVECPGCGLWDEPLCATCADVLDGPVRRCEGDVPRLDRMDGSPPLPVWAVAAYVDPVRGVVVAWKDRGRADLTRRLVATASRLGAGAAPSIRAVAGRRTVRLVPVPSAPGARRRRGADLVRLLAQGAARGLADHGVAADVVPLLARRRGGRDQVGLGVRARGRNTAGSLRVRGSGRSDPADRLHVLVDDVVTTGSTLAACRDAVSGSGGVVLGALVLAATPPPSRDPGPLLPTVPGG